MGVTGLRGYRDRREAGQILAEQLERLKGRADLVVLGIPRGGLEVAAVVARVLSAPLDVLPARKLGAPGNPEFAIGAVAEDVEYIDADLVFGLGIPRRHVEAERERQRALSREQGLRLRGGRPPLSVEGRTVLVVDDGIATGATVQAALQALRSRRPKWLILAVPVGPADALERLSHVADEVVCPLVPPYFRSVGAFYEKFDQVSDEEAIAFLVRESPTTDLPHPS